MTETAKRWRVLPTPICGLMNRTAPKPPVWTQRVHQGQSISALNFAVVTKNIVEKNSKTHIQVHQEHRIYIYSCVTTETHIENHKRSSKMH